MSFINKINFKRSASILVLLFLFIATLIGATFLVDQKFGPKEKAQAAGNRYWVGGAATANWNESTGGITNWGTVSNTRDNASVPDSTNDVIFDGAANGNTPCTLSASTTINSLVMTGWTNTLTHNTTVTLTIDSGDAGGNSLLMVAGMGYTTGATSKITFTGAGTSKITTGGKVLNRVEFSNAGDTFQLQDNLTISGTGASSLSSSSFVLTAGTFDPNLKTVTFTGATPRIDGAPTFYNLTRTGNAATTDNLQFAGNVTVTNNFTCTGNSTINRMLLTSETPGTARTLTLTGATVTITNVDVQDITFVYGANLDLTYAGTVLSGDCGGNTLSGGFTLTFTTPVTQTWTNAAGGNWYDAANWTSRVPLPQDDVVMNMGSNYNSGVTVQGNMPRLGKNIDWTGATWTGTATRWTLTSPNSIYGSLTLLTTMNWTANSNAFFLSGRGATYNFITGGKPFYILYVAAPTGTYNLGDAFTTTTINVNQGTFNTNGYAVTAANFQSSGSSTRAVNITNSTITIINGAGGWVMAASGLTFTSTGSTISLNHATGNTIFNGGVLTYNNITIAPSSGLTTFSSAFTFANMTMTAAGTKTVKFTKTTTYTMTETNFLNGTAANLITIDSDDGATAFTMNKTSGTIIADYLAKSRMVVGGGAVWYSTANSTPFPDPNINGNLGWTASGSGNIRTISPTGGNWSATTAWNEAAVPTSADNVYGLVSSGPITVDAASVAKTLDFATNSYTNTMTHNAFTLTVSGSVTFVAGMTYTPVASSTLAINATGTLISAGKTVYNLTTSVGTITLSDAAIISNNFTISSGTVVAPSTTLTIGGNWLNTGIFTASTSTVTMNGATQQDLTSGGQSFNNLTIKNTSANGVRPVGTLAVGGNLTLTADGASAVTLDNANNVAVNVTGDLSTNSGVGAGARNIKLGNSTWTVTGNVDFTSGTLTAGASTLAMSGAGKILTPNGQTLYSFESSGTISAAADFIVSSIFNISAGTFDGTSRTITLSGSGTPFVKTGAFTYGTSTINYTGASATTVAAATYYNLGVGTTSDAGVAVTYTLGGNTTVSSVLTVGNAGSTNTDLLAGTGNLIYLTGAGTPFNLTSKGDLSSSSTNSIYYTATSATNITGSAYYYNLGVGTTSDASAVTYTLLGDVSASTVTIGNAASGANDTLAASNKTITLSSAAQPLIVTAKGLFSADTGTVIMNSSGNVTVSALTYYVLNLTPTISADRAWVTAGAVTVNSNFTINPTASSASLLTLTLGGDLYVSGTTTIKKTTSATSILDTKATNSYAFASGILDIQAGGTLTSNASTVDINGNATNAGTLTATTTTMTIAGSWSNTGTFTAGSGTITFDAATTGKTIAGTMTGGSSFNNIIFNNAAGGWSFSNAATIGGNFTVTTSDTVSAGVDINGQTIIITGNFQMDAGKLTTGAAAVTAAGNWSVNGGTQTATGSTVNFTAGATGKTIKSTGQHFNNLIFNNAIGGWSFSDAANIDGNLTITTSEIAGAGVNLNGQTLDLNGNFQMDAGKLTTGTSLITLAGNWTRNGGTFVANTSGVTFDGSALQTILSGGQSFNNLTVANGSVAGTTFADSATIADTFSDNIPDSKVTFHAGSTYTIVNIDLDGSSGHNINLLSSTPGTHWIFNVSQLTPTVTYVTPADSDATAGSEINDTVGGVNGGNNHHWLFGVSSIVVTPASATLDQGVTQTFTAKAFDGIGVEILGALFTWSTVVGGGTIDGSGVFTAGTVAGTFSNTVKASSGGVNGYASVVVNPLPAVTPTPTSPTSIIGTGEIKKTPVVPTESAPATEKKKEDIILSDFQFYAALESGNVQININDYKNIEVVNNTNILVEISADIFAKKVNIITLTTADSTYLMNLLSGKNKYQAVIPMPAVKGSFEFRILIVYEDGSIKEIKKTVTVDPQGFVYTMSSNYFGLGKKQEVRIADAKVTLYKVDGGKSAVWNSGGKQPNPITTNKSGEYAFWVPSGEYYLTAEKAGYKTVKTKNIKVDNSLVIENIQVEAKFKPWIWLVIAGAVIIIAFLLILRQKKIANRRAQL